MTTRNKEDSNTSIDQFNSENIYEFYQDHLIPSILASFPFLFRRIGNDFYQLVATFLGRTVTFLIPWSHHSSSSLSTLWNQSVRAAPHPNFTQTPTALVDFIMRHLDANKDGNIKPQEVLLLRERLEEHLRENYLSGLHFDWSWWYAWPMMDWKIGVFLWRTCGGFLLIFAILTIIPGRMHGLGKVIIRWPILGFTYLVITVELIVYAILRLFIRFAETIVATSKHRKLRWEMTQAKSYKEWYKIAKELDISQGRDSWMLSVGDESSNNYNWGFIKELMSELRLARKSNDSIMALAVLQQCTRKNVGGIMNYEIFSHTNCGEPKNIVKEFIEEVETSLRWVTKKAKNISLNNVNSDNTSYKKALRSKKEEEREKLVRSMLAWATLNLIGRGNDQGHENLIGNGDIVQEECLGTESESSISSNEEDTKLPPIHKEKVIVFLKRAKAAYGRTCLCLSGGAMMGCYHFGIVLSLFEQNAIPHIISGTSAGSCIAAMICTRTDEEIKRDFTPEKVRPKMTVFERSWINRMKNVYQNGSLFEADDWMKLLKWFTFGDMTFEEAYRKTGRILCVTISSPTKKVPPILINYISAPDVVITSAVLASAAVPGFIKPVRLQVKDPDGNIRYQADNKDESYWDGSIEQDIPISALSETFNCQFFLASQCNPHIVPFFYSNKGDVGKPSRWSRNNSRDSWRGGFLLSALEVYLKSDMRAKFHFLNDIEVALGFTSTLMTQQFEGTVTIVPQVRFIDFFKLFSDPSPQDMEHYFHAGSVAAYHYIAMVKLHYRISHALDECLDILENDVNKSGKMYPNVVKLK